MVYQNLNNVADSSLYQKYIHIALLEFLYKLTTISSEFLLFQTYL